MSTDPKLEVYLASLDKALSGISVSERADIVTEIKSHVLDARERDSTQSIESILAALGEPEIVANRYLLERGLKPGRPPKHPIVKWLAIGVLGTIGIVVTGVIVLVWTLSPVVKIDGQNERVTLLGGLIDIDGKAGKLSIGSTVLSDDGGSRRVNGLKTPSAALKDFKIDFSNGKVEVSPSTDGQLSWDCKVDGGQDAYFVSETKSSVTLNFGKAKGMRCEVRMPEKIRYEITGGNGKIEIERPTSAVVASLTNGSIEFTADPNRKYRFNTAIALGKTDTFPTDTGPDAIPVKLEVKNGKLDYDLDH